MQEYLKIMCFFLYYHYYLVQDVLKGRQFEDCEPPICTLWTEHLKKKKRGFFSIPSLCVLVWDLGCFPVTVFSLFSIRKNAQLATTKSSWTFDCLLLPSPLLHCCPLLTHKSQCGKKWWPAFVVLAAVASGSPHCWWILQLLPPATEQSN